MGQEFLEICSRQDQEYLRGESVYLDDPISIDNDLG